MKIIFVFTLPAFECLQIKSTRRRGLRGDNMEIALITFEQEKTLVDTRLNKVQ